MTPTKENRAFCLRQISRCEGLNFFSTLTEVGLRELRDSLVLNSASEAQAELIVSTWISQSSERPTPADLKRIADTLNAAAETQVPAPCDKCAPFGGFLPCEITLEQGIFAGEKRTLFVPCYCELGKTKRAAAKRLREEDPHASNSPRQRETGGDFLRAKPEGLIS